MKVLIAVNKSPKEPGGISRYVSNLSQELTYRGHSVRIVYPERTINNKGLRMVHYWRRMAKEIREFCPDIVSSHFALSAIPVGWFLKVPLITHFHGPWALEEQIEGASTLKVKFITFLERMIYKRSISVIFDSESFRAVGMRTYGISYSRSTVLPIGVDSRFLLSSVAPKPQIKIKYGIQSSMMVLSVRRLVPRMGLDVLIRAWPRVEMRIPEAVLVVVGDGPLRATLGELCCEVMAKNVKFLGAISDDDLVDLYRKAQVSVLPTRYLEGFGIPVLESWACGTPVIASDVDSLTELVGHHTPELLVPNNDINALSAAIINVLLKITPLSLGHRELVDLVKTKYSWHSIAPRIEAIYQDAGEVE